MPKGHTKWLEEFSLQAPRGDRGQEGKKGKKGYTGDKGQTATPTNNAFSQSMAVFTVSDPERFFRVSDTEYTKYVQFNDVEIPAFFCEYQNLGITNTESVAATWRVTYSVTVQAFNADGDPVISFLRMTPINDGNQLTTGVTTAHYSSPVTTATLTGQFITTVEPFGYVTVYVELTTSEDAFDPIVDARSMISIVHT